MTTRSRLAPGDPARGSSSAPSPIRAPPSIPPPAATSCCASSAPPPTRTRAAIEAVRRRGDLFDDHKFSFFGVSVDPADEREQRVADSYPGYRFFWDFDGRVSRLFGALPADVAQGEGQLTFNRLWYVIDPTLRIMRVIPFAADGRDIPALLAYLDALPPPARFAGFEVQAPVLVLPNVFEPEFCAKLVGLYEANGGIESGFMREVDGKTIAMQNHAHKRRRDYVIDDPNLIAETQARFMRRVVPEIRKGHFRAHRDNTTKGTAHRRFAVSVNLNEDFDGGEVSFPEYGPKSFKAPTGGAVVFSCSLLHAVSKVTRGRRYAFLPFLYDDAAAKIREANNAFLGDGVTAYQNTTRSAGEG